MVVDPQFIRNFSIVAHIDHGKSTLADQLLLQSGAVSTREFRAEVLAISAKTGMGVPDVFQAIIERVPPPAGDPKAPLRALIFDSKFDDYQGVITYVRVVDGTLRVGQRIRLMAGATEFEVMGLG